jgi:hypothetical protein
MRILVNRKALSRALKSLSPAVSLGAREREGVYSQVRIKTVGIDAVELWAVNGLLVAQVTLPTDEVEVVTPGEIQLEHARLASLADSGDSEDVEIVADERRARVKAGRVSGTLGLGNMLQWPPLPAIPVDGWVEVAREPLFSALRRAVGLGSKDHTHHAHPGAILGSDGRSWRILSTEGKMGSYETIAELPEITWRQVLSEHWRTISGMGGEGQVEIVTEERWWWWRGEGWVVACRKREGEFAAVAGTTVGLLTSPFQVDITLSAEELSALREAVAASSTSSVVGEAKLPSPIVWDADPDGWTMRSGTEVEEVVWTDRWQKPDMAVVSWCTGDVRGFAAGLAALGEMEGECRVSRVDKAAALRFERGLLVVMFAGYAKAGR